MGSVWEAGVGLTFFGGLRNEIMWNMNDVKFIEYQGGYIFRVIFDDKKAGNIDFAPYLEKGPVF